jgi:hypothetical protein
MSGERPIDHESRDPIPADLQENLQTEAADFAALLGTLLQRGYAIGFDGKMLEDAFTPKDASPIPGHRAILGLYI